MPRIPDHLVYAVHDLDRAIADFTQLLGIAPVVGGRHEGRGTKNALLNLGNGCYLEVIAIDEWNTTVAPPRWMGLDVLETPQITRWCLKSDDLASDQAVLKTYNPQMGAPWNGQRTTASGELLAWEMLLPLPTPEVEVMPFMVDWSTSSFHPTERLEEKCTLLKLELTHPEPEEVKPYLERLGVALAVRVGEQARIRALLECQTGEVWV